ncbi:hypothetical protein BH09BAC1_BH09BAC1_01580 [soil metagenome]
MYDFIGNCCLVISCCLRVICELVAGIVIGFPSTKATNDLLTLISGFGVGFPASVKRPEDKLLVHTHGIRTKQ